MSEQIQTTEVTQPVATETTTQTTATATPILSSTQQQTQPLSGKTWKEAISQEYRSNPNASGVYDILFSNFLRGD